MCWVWQYSNSYHCSWWYSSKHPEMYAWNSQWMLDPKIRMGESMSTKQRMWTGRKVEIPEGPQKSRLNREQLVFSFWFYFQCSYHKLILLLPSGKTSPALLTSTGDWLKFFKIIYVLAVLVLHCYAGFSLVAASSGLHSVVVLGLLIVVASLVWTTGSRACGVQ